MEARIARTLLGQLIARAAASPTTEVCGLLLGRGSAEAGWQVTEAPAAANVSPRPADRFELDPATLLAALRSERDGGPAVLGHYHSHPSGGSEPSARDAAAAGPGRLWLILAGGEARLWRAATGGGFRPVALALAG